MLGGVAYLENSYLTRNGLEGVSALGTATLYLRHCDVRGNNGANGTNSGTKSMHCDPECHIRFKRCTGDVEAEKMFALHKPPHIPKPLMTAAPTMVAMTAVGVGTHILPVG